MALRTAFPFYFTLPAVLTPSGSTLGLIGKLR